MDWFWRNFPLSEIKNCAQNFYLLPRKTVHRNRAHVQNKNFANHDPDGTYFPKLKNSN